MSQIFHRRANALVRTTLVGAIGFIGFLGWAGYELDYSHWNTRARVPQEQSVPFSHKHHVGGEGFDCRYCHTSVENFQFRGDSAHPDLHELPFADLEDEPHAGAGTGQLSFA